ncbi:MAG: phage major capsid protein [Vibrio gallaecicus]
MTTELELKGALTELHEKIEAKLQAVAEKSEAKGAEYKESIAELDKSIKSLNDQILEVAQKHAVAPEVIEAKSFGTQVLESAGIKSFIAGETNKGRTEVKNTIVNSGNASSVHDQLAGVVPGAFRQLTVMPTVMQGSAASNIIYYSKELLWTNAAAATAEGTDKPESTLTFEEVNVAVKTIPTYLRVSKQALSDSTFLASYIERRLRHGVNVAVENYVINDTSDGWLAAANNTATSPLLAVDVYGLANRMKMEVISADYEPSYFYMNPADWGVAETTRRAAGDNAFVAASGAVSYVNNGLTPLLWGLPVVLSNNVPEGTMICKSADADMYANRESTMVEMFEQDGDNVTKNLVTVRAETRGAELVFTPAAIRTGDITGITS